MRKKERFKSQVIIISPYIREEGKKECEFWGIKYYDLTKNFFYFII
jgi:hypothetical protein